MEAALARGIHSAAMQVMDFAQLDSWRRQRTGFPEVMYAPGKSPQQIAAILERMAANESMVMATRVELQVRLASLSEMQESKPPKGSCHVQTTGSGNKS